MPYSKTAGRGNALHSMASVHLFSMPYLVKPQGTLSVIDKKTMISCLAMAMEGGGGLGLCHVTGPAAVAC